MSTVRAGLSVYSDRLAHSRKLAPTRAGTREVVCSVPEPLWAQPRKNASTQWTPILRVREEPRWTVEALKQLLATAEVANNWDGCGAQTPNAVAVGLAVEVLQALGSYDLRPDYIDPSVEDGVCISFREARKYADIECFNSGAVLAVVSDGKGRPIAWEVDRSESHLKGAIARIRSFLRS